MKRQTIQLHPTGAGMAQTIYSEIGDGAAGRMALRVLSSGQLQVLRYTGSGTTVQFCTSSNTVPVGLLTHVAGSFDGSSFATFVNGQPTVSALVGTFSPTGDVRTRIGAAQDGVELFDGVIDELTLYRRPLPVNEIDGIFLSTFAGKCKNCTPIPPGNVLPGGRRADSLRDTASRPRSFRKALAARETPTNRARAGLATLSVAGPFSFKLSPAKSRGRLRCVRMEHWQTRKGPQQENHDARWIRVLPTLSHGSRAGAPQFWLRGQAHEA